jgi:hypothetical protein
MSTIAKNIIPRKLAESATTTQYTAPVGTRTIIDKMTGTNISAAPVTVDVYLVPSGGTAGDAYRVVKAKTIAVNEAYTFPAVIGQILETGGFIATAASAGSAVVLSASGREIA